jgi:glucose-1-phosphate cytidylyltransferase
MKVLILAGGFGTRISEESHLKPKPMVEIGDNPILWHIMKIYSSFGYNDFVILAGYKQYVIKEYFANYFLHHSDITFDMANNNIEVHERHSEPWKVTVIDTGLNTMTGGRIKRAKEYIGNEPFMLTYGDGVADVDINALVALHKKSKKLVTLTAYSVAQTKGVLDLKPDGTVNEFREKSDADGAVINAGFMVCEPQVLDFIDGDQTAFEKEPLKKIASLGQLNAYKHTGFWHCMDTKRDMDQLNEMWNTGKAPWKVWKD